MKEKIEKFLLQKEEIEKELREYVKDQSIPLESRWDLFVSSDLGEERSYILELESYNLDKYYDRGWMDRGTTIDFDRIYDYLYDYELEDYDEEEPEYQEIKDRIEDKINTIKEELLSLFIKSWRFDWYY